MFVSVCNKNYLIGFEVMLKSLIDNNPRIVEEQIPFCLISNDLTESDLFVSKKIYENIFIRNFDSTPYKELENLKDNKVGFGDYTKYEIFNIDSEKIIFLDSDIVVLGNIDYLIDFTGDIGAVRDLYIDQYNTGVLVINKKFIMS